MRSNARWAATPGGGKSARPHPRQIPLERQPCGRPFESRAVDSCSRSGPEGGGASTSQGHPLAIFRRALQRENLTVAEAVARELPRLDLLDTLELTILIARKDPRRHPRVAARWLLRYLEECEETTIDEAAMVAACLAALAGHRHRDAALSLQALAARATSRARARGVG